MDRIKSYSLSRDIETSECTGYKYIHYGDIHKKVADIVDENSNLPNIKVGNYELLEKGDLILADASEDYEGIATPALINVDLPYKVVAGLHTIALRPKQVNPLFLYFMILSPRFRKYGYRVGTGMKVFGISVNNLLKFENGFPSLEEQGEIADFLIQLDKTIALHQRKLDKLKQLKLAYLQALFPNENELTPQIRFANFEGDWVQRKFIELLDTNDGIRRGPFGSALKKDLFVPTSNYVVYEQQNAIYDRWETRYNISEEKFVELHKFVLSEGDFIMSGAGTIGRIAKVPRGIKQGIFNQALIRFKINQDLTDSNYFLEWIRSDSMQRKFTEANPGSAMTNLVPMAEVKEWAVSLPSIAEQQKIGEFFNKLSDIIALHQKKLMSIKKLKSLYLQKMFC